MEAGTMALPDVTRTVDCERPEVEEGDPIAPVERIDGETTHDGFQLFPESWIDHGVSEPISQFRQGLYAVSAYLRRDPKPVIFVRYVHPVNKRATIKSYRAHESEDGAFAPRSLVSDTADWPSRLSFPMVCEIRPEPTMRELAYLFDVYDLSDTRYSDPWAEASEESKTMVTPAGVQRADH